MTALRDLSAVGLLALSSCHVGLDAFEPVTQQSARERGAEISVQRIVYQRQLLSQKRAVLIAASLPPGSRIAAAAIDSPHTPPCSARAAPLRLVVERTGVGGVSALFELELAGEPEGPRVLDVELRHEAAAGESKHCVRIPLTGAELPWRRIAGSDFALQGGLRVEAVTADRSLGSVVSVPIGVVVHKEQLRLGASTGVASGSCDEELCGRDSEDLLRSGLVLPIELGADYLFGSRRDRWGLSARYALRIAWTPEAPGERRHVIHAPNLALLWLLTHRERPPGWPTQGAAAGFGIELPVGVWYDATSAETGWFAGLGVTAAWPLY